MASLHPNRLDSTENYGGTAPGKAPSIPSEPGTKQEVPGSQSKCGSSLERCRVLRVDHSRKGPWKTFGNLS